MHTEANCLEEKGVTLQMAVEVITRPMQSIVGASLSACDTLACMHALASLDLQTRMAL